MPTRGTNKHHFKSINHIFVPILEINVKEHIVQNLQFADLSSSKGAAEQRKETLTYGALSMSTFNTSFTA